MTIAHLWLAASLALAALLVPSLLIALRRGLGDRLVGLELSAAILAQLLFAIAIAIGRVPFVDVGLALALLSFGGGLVFARFLERWL